MGKNDYRFNLFYKNKIIFKNGSLRRIAYEFCNHFSETPKNEFNLKEFKDFKEFQSYLNKKIQGTRNFVLSLDEINLNGEKNSELPRKSNYTLPNQPYLKYGDKQEYGVFNQWTYTEQSKKQNFNKFIESIEELGYSVEEIINQQYNIAGKVSEENTAYKVGNQRITGAINKIYFGSPGTGKSNLVEAKYGKNSKRVTFYPEYSYVDFVGSIKPVIKNDNDISYEFIPGVFTEILYEAIKNKDTIFSLIIEELNRANASAVFGDLFQLLDRNENGESIYGIYHKEICDYLKSKNDISYNKDYIKIPSNLNIIATMNISDQNAFTMDTAFKRRWQFEYVEIEFKNSHNFKDKEVLSIKNESVTWENFVICVNEFMMSEQNEDLMISEDKQIGPYFIKENELSDKSNFAYKVLLYLWEDVFKLDRHRLFNKNIRNFSNLKKQFCDNNNSYKIFNDQFLKNLESISSKSDESDMSNEK